MDFSEILRIASENQGCKLDKTGIDTSLGKPKRNVQDKKAKGVKSAAVQAFLKKQELEEKKQAEEARKKKENLMKIREEKNTVGKLRKIIKRNHTKEAIFEVEGTDKKGDKQDVAQSPSTDQQINGKIEYTKLKSQYGGKERRALFQNVVRKPVSAHWEPKEEDKDEGKSKKDDSAKSSKESDVNKSSSSNSNSSKTGSSKDRGKSSNSSSHKSSKEDSGKSQNDSKKGGAEIKPEKPKKKKPQGPPPMSFDAILKLAQQKKEDPSKKPGSGTKTDSNGKKSKLPDRPMTKEEKERWERVHTKEYQAWIKHGKQRPDFCVDAKPRKNKTASPGNKNGVSAISNEFVKEEDSSCSETEETLGELRTCGQKNTKQSQNSGHTGSVQKGQGHSNRVPSKDISGKTESKGKPLAYPQQKEGTVKGTGYAKTLKLKGAPCDNVTKNSHVTNHVTKKESSVQKSGSSSKTSTKQSTSSHGKSSSYNEVHENVLVCGSKSGSVQEKQKLPKQEMSAWDRAYSQVKKKKKPEKKKRVIESESEYSDEDLDGFIDDDEDDMDGFIDDSEAMDYSKHIRDIFGYNKDKYRYMDEEDSDDMEAGFAEIEREERVSAKIGMREDLEDMKMEEEHKKRKMAMKRSLAKKQKYR